MISGSRYIGVSQVFRRSVRNVSFRNLEGTEYSRTGDSYVHMKEVKKIGKSKKPALENVLYCAHPRVGQMAAKCRPPHMPMD